MEEFGFQPRYFALKSIFVVPFEFTIVPFFNSARHKNLMDTNTSQARRKENMILVTNAVVKLPEGICNPTLVQEVAKKSIRKGKELFINHVARYWNDK